MTDSATGTDATALKPTPEAPPAEEPRYDLLPAEEKQQVEGFIAEIDLSSSHSIIAFGTGAQKEVTQVADEILEGVRNKDTGAVGENLNTLVTEIRSLDTQPLKENKKPGFLSRLFGAVTGVQKFLQQYETVQSQIDSIVRDLESHKDGLVRDIVLLDKLYEGTLSQFHRLELYIIAGEERLRRMEEDDLPAARKAAEDGNDPVKAQEARDLAGMRDELERKVHNLKLTRQVAMQTLPGIRKTQETDKSLVNKIQSSIINTVPLWKQQLATLVSAQHTREAAEATRKVDDMTNQLLKDSATTLREANREAQEQVERGVFDIEAIEAANNEIIGLIQDSLETVEEGRKARADAESRLKSAEGELKKALLESAG